MTDERILTKEERMEVVDEFMSDFYQNANRLCENIGRDDLVLSEEERRTLAAYKVFELMHSAYQLENMRAILSLGQRNKEVKECNKFLHQIVEDIAGSDIYQSAKTKKGALENLLYYSK